jgi:hypothetical protein
MYSHACIYREREDLSLQTSMQDQVFQFSHWTSVTVHVIVYKLLKIYCINSSMQNRAILSKLLFLDPAITYATMKDSTHGHGRRHQHFFKLIAKYVLF